MTYDLNPRIRPQRSPRANLRLQTHTIQSPAATPPEKPKNLSWVWRDWLEYSSFHGVLDLSRPHYGSCWKASWILVMISFTIATLYSVREVVDEYVTNPTVQNYREESVGMLDLPDVILCTHQRFNATKLHEMGAAPDLIHDLLSGDITEILRRGRSGGVEEEFRTKIAKYQDFRLKNKNVTYEEIFRIAAISCESLVKECSWGPSCCNQSTPFLHLLYGQCYRFETSGPARVKQTYPGPNSGIQMALKVPPVNIESKTSALRGVLVEFAYPNESTSFSYSQIPAGVAATVHLSLQITERINLFGRPRTCFDSDVESAPADSDGRITLDTMRTTSNGCFWAMWSLSMAKFCNCTQMPNIVDIPLCEPYDGCLRTQQRRIQDEADRLKSINCLPQCTTRSYSAAVTYSNFDSAAYNRAIDNCNQSSPIAEDDTILLDIYHPRMSYVKVQEVEVYSVMTLISNIGGAVGLWLGASLMSILQIGFYFIKWISVRNRE